MSVAAGVVALSYVNAASAFHFGEEAAVRLTSTNYSDVKLRRNDKLLLIGTEIEIADGRGQQVKSLNLFKRLTCIIFRRDSSSPKL